MGIRISFHLQFLAGNNGAFFYFLSFFLEKSLPCASCSDDNVPYLGVLWHLQDVLNLPGDVRDLQWGVAGWGVHGLVSARQVGEDLLGKNNKNMLCSKTWGEESRNNSFRGAFFGKKGCSQLEFNLFFPFIFGVQNIFYLIVGEMYFSWFFFQTSVATTPGDIWHMRR